MVKGFIFFRDGRIPFVIENYRMELFTDDTLLDDFIHEYGCQKNYILHGQCFEVSHQGQKATFLVEFSIVGTCYLRCYILDMFTMENEYDAIGFQSPFLDDIFRYKYNYLDLVKEGINFDATPKDIYKVPFSMNSNQYELSFRIGHNNRLGEWEDFDKKGEILVPLVTSGIQECYDIAKVLHRFVMFMVSYSDVSFKRICLYNKNNLVVGLFYCPLILEEAASTLDMHFYEFNVMKYAPKILDNIALDTGNKITRSIPLGHLGNFNSLFSPQRFIEQVMAFEYLFDKLEPKKAKDKKFSLKKELEYMFNEFPQLISTSQLSAGDISDQIKKIRTNIVHGYAYYYDFKNDSDIQYLIIWLDKLIRSMSLLLIGFSKDEVVDFCV